MCGTCFQCRTGQAHVCRRTKILGIDVNGVFAEYAVIPESNLIGCDASIPPEIASVQEQAKWEDAIETLRLLRREGLVSNEEFNEMLAVFWHEQAIAEEKTGHPDASISSLERSLKAQGEFVPSLLSLGEAHIRHGSPEKAMKTWEGALMERYHPALVRALENYRIEHGQEKELIQFYKKASSRTEIARLLLARLYLRQNLIEDAEAEVTKVPNVEASPEPC